MTTLDNKLNEAENAAHWDAILRGQLELVKVHCSADDWQLNGVDLRLGQGGGSSAEERRSTLRKTLVAIQAIVRQLKLKVLTQPPALRRDIFDMCGKPTAARLEFTRKFEEEKEMIVKAQQTDDPELVELDRRYENRCFYDADAKEERKVTEVTYHTSRRTYGAVTVAIDLNGDATTNESVLYGLTPEDLDEFDVMIAAYVDRAECRERHPNPVVLPKRCKAKRGAPRRPRRPP